MHSYARAVCTALAQQSACAHGATSWAVLTLPPDPTGVYTLILQVSTRDHQMYVKYAEHCKIRITIINFHGSDGCAAWSSLERRAKLKGAIHAVSLHVTNK